ncbi:hypothetical protein ACH5RR_023406 [Cinchona calisaya]|uniref:Myb/SANT-like domain-containing protein n=1 Tax=Cinchona calisaya TaxID=153742 RepID=A0ABD2ZC53_9GENT
MNDPCNELANWKTNPGLLITFVNTLVEFKRDGSWDPKHKTPSNWTHITKTVNSTCGVNLKTEQYSSKYYRLMDEWKICSTLMAKSKYAITGLGFNWELLCFQASSEHWMTLIQENSKFKQFNTEKSCAMYMTLDEIFEGKTTTDSQAYSSFQSPLPSKQRPRGSFSTKQKGKAHTSLNFEDKEVYTPSYKQKASKRPVSNLDNSSQEGSRSTKSARSVGIHS